MIQVFTFYLFATLLIAAASLTILARNPVHSVLWLITAFFNAAGLMVLVGAEFIAMLLVIVYVGAVAVLFLFVVMLVGVDSSDSLVETIKGQRVAAVLFVAIFVAPAWRDDAPGSLADYRPDRLASSQSRSYLWETALELVERRPWLGVGPMHYAHHPNDKAAHPHNFYLQLASEWGLPLTLIVATAGAYVLLRLARALRRRRESGEVDEGACLLMACLAVCTDAMFSGNLVMPVSQVWIAVLLGWSLCWTSLNGGQPAVAAIHPGLRRGFGMAAVVLQVWLVFNVWPEIVDLPRHLQATAALHPTERLQPRFWSQGRF